MIEKNLPLYGYNFSVSFPDRSKEGYRLMRDTMFEYCENQDKTFEPYDFDSTTKQWSFIKIDGELYFMHTAECDSIIMFRMKDRAKTEFVFKGITILDIYCPRYIDLVIRKEDITVYDNGINSRGDEDEIDFYSFLKEENKEYRKGQSQYTDFFFISGYKTSSENESIYLIDVSNFPDIKIIDQKVTKVPYLPLDKCIVLNKNDSIIDYSVISLKNNNKLDLHNEEFTKVYHKIKEIENKECKSILLSVVTEVDKNIFDNSRKCYSFQYTKLIEEAGVNTEFHILTYQVGDKKFYVQISTNKNHSLWMVTSKTTIKSGKINELDYEFVMNYLYK